MSIPTKWRLEKDICDAYEAKNHTSSSLHGHYHFLLIYITQGSGVQTLNGREIPFSEGDLFLLSPADFHKNTVETGCTYNYYGVKFPFELLNKRLSGLFEISELPITVTVPEKSRHSVKDIFERLIEESANGFSRIANKIYLENMVEELIIIALRELPRERLGNTSEFLNRSLGYLYSHFFENITVNDVAEHIGYTTNYFNFKFKEAIGIPLGEYLKNLRLTYSENLLRSSEMSVTEIALESGFGNLSYFSRAFKEQYGISPKQYRKLHGTSDEWVSAFNANEKT